jgi:AcrR family transcriptional regulator
MSMMRSEPSREVGFLSAQAESTIAKVGRRAQLTRERILAAALALADANGLEALTMRHLAHTLGFEAMSLYYYVASKDDLVDGIVDLVVREIELPSLVGDWKTAIRASAISAHQVLRRHPWACNPLMSGPRLLPSRLRMVDALLGRLAEADLPSDLADRGYHALDSHILGFTLWEAGYSIALRDTPPDLLAKVVLDLGLEAFPHLLAHVAFHERPPRLDQKPAFEFGLDLILDGLERTRDSA